jgi:hypothetical protein
MKRQASWFVGMFAVLILVSQSSFAQKRSWGKASIASRGTTYAPKLRLFIPTFSEDSWVSFAHTFRVRPPMPWWSLHTMHDADLSSIYRFVKSLGPTGVPAPSYQPPGQKPGPPYFLFVPAAQ